MLSRNFQILKSSKSKSSYRVLLSDDEHDESYDVTHYD
jgi:hypothetical protein